MALIKDLYELQGLDLEIVSREKALAEVRARLADNSAVASARRELQRLEAQLEQAASSRRTVELAIAQVEDKLKAIEGRLYSGAIKSVREMAATESERESLASQRSEREEKLLELMVQIEDLQTARAGAGETLSRLESERGAEYANLQQREKALQGELKALEQARSQATSQVPASALATYESLRKTRGGQAVARVERDMCQGCRLKLPSGEVQRAKTSPGIVQCSSCRRILYVAQ